MSLGITANTPLVLERLQEIAQRIGNLAPAMGAIGMELEARISGRFESQTDPLGHKWAAWAPSTLENYPDNGNRRLLDRYGDMLGSLSHHADSDSTTVGFGQPQAAYHEFSTEKMPRRGLLFADPEAGTLTPDDERAALKILDGFLDQAIGQ